MLSTAHHAPVSAPPQHSPLWGRSSWGGRAAVIFQPGLILNMLRADTDDPHQHLHTGIVAQMLHN